MKYLFEYMDDEFDTYESEPFDSKSEALAAIKAVRQQGCVVKETWIYDEDGKFVGRF